MKASRCLTAFAPRMLAVLLAPVFLVQCAMPSREAWGYIQTRGLLPYLSYSSQHASPPFRTSGSSSQRYAASPAYPQRRSAYPQWNSGTQNRGYYGATNNYFSPQSSSSDSPRYVPRSRPSAPSGNRSPKVKMPVEEPSSAPQITHNQPPASSAPTNGSTPAPPPATESLPYGSPVPGRMNMVNSPFAGKTQLVDVSGMSAGQTVKCPYTGKLFKVPPTQQAANHAEPRLESKVDASKLSDEPKAGDKKP